MRDREPFYGVGLLDFLRRSSRPESSKNPADYPRWTEVTDPEALAAYGAMAAKRAEGEALDAQINEVSQQYARLRRRLLRVLASKHPTIADESHTSTWKEFEGKLYYVGTDEEA